MTDIEQKALALVNEVRLEREVPLTERALDRDSYTYQEALCRAIEQHEAFRKEVSDAVKAYVGTDNYLGKFNDTFGRFIIAKRDPLVEMGREIGISPIRLEELRAAIEKRGGKIVWGEGG